MKYRITALLLALFLLCLLPVTAQAHEVPDESRTGTITVEMKYDGMPISGGTLAAYRVGQIRQEDGNYSFVKTAKLADFPGDLADLTSPTLAEELAAFVRANRLAPDATAKNRGGTAAFPNLELGLYLIVQTGASYGYTPLAPFLVSIPMEEDGHYVYEVNAEGKFQLQPEKPGDPDRPDRPEPPVTPTEPSEPTLPQTGQLNWPIPVLAVLGLGLFSMGWALRFGKKRGGDET